MAGYAELMNTIFDDFSVIPLSENYVKQLHKILLQFVGKDEWHRGEYKKLTNSVAAFAPDGTELGIVFETASPFDTPQMMEKLIDWTRKNLDDTYIHPLITIGIFVVHFLSIHPFGSVLNSLKSIIFAKKRYDTYIRTSLSILPKQ